MPTLDVLEVLRTAFNCAKKNFVTLCAVAAIVYIPLGVLGNIASHFVVHYVMGSYLADAPALGADPSPRQVLQTQLMIFNSTMLNVAVISMVAILTDALAKGVMFLAIFDFLRDKKPNWVECIRLTLSRAWPLIATSLLMGFGFSIGMLLCVIPGLYLIVSWAVAVPAVIAEKASPTTALSRSSMLTQGNRWATFGVLVLVGIASTVVVALVSLPIRMVAMGYISQKPQEWIFGSAAQFLVFGTNILLQVPMAAVSASVIGVLYVRLRTIKEGADVGEMAKVFE